MHLFVFASKIKALGDMTPMDGHRTKTNMEDLQLRIGICLSIGCLSGASCDMDMGWSMCCHGCSGIQTFPTSRDWRKRLAKAKTKTARKWQSKCFSGVCMRELQALAAHWISVETAKEIGRVSRFRRAGWVFGTCATAGTTLFVEGRGREVDASLSVRMADVFAMLTLFAGWFVLR